MRGQAKRSVERKGKRRGQGGEERVKEREGEERRRGDGCREEGCRREGVEKKMLIEVRV